MNIKNRDIYKNNLINKFPYKFKKNSNPNITYKMLPSNDNINENLYKTDSAEYRNINYMNIVNKENNIPIKKDIYNMKDFSECNSDDINEMNSQSYAKSLLSEYVEDLDVIQYKDDNKSDN